MQVARRGTLDLGQLFFRQEALSLQKRLQGQFAEGGPAAPRVPQAAFADVFSSHELRGKGEVAFLLGKAAELADFQ